MRRATLVLLTAFCLPALARAADVEVPGSDRKFSDTRTATVGGQSVAMKLTGVGLREKAFFNVYVIASYLASGTDPHSPAELAAADAPKMMVLVLERDVDGPKMAEALSDGIRNNYPKGMDAEIKQLEGFLESRPLSKGDEVDFTWQPGVGVTCAISGKGSVTVKGAAFAKAVWEIWLGAHPVQGDLKTGLSARL